MKDLQNQKEMREAEALDHEAKAKAHIDKGDHLKAAAQMDLATVAHNIAGNSDAANLSQQAAFNLRRYGKMSGQDRRTSSQY